MRNLKCSVRNVKPGISEVGGLFKDREPPYPYEWDLLKLHRHRDRKRGEEGGHVSGQEEVEEVEEVEEEFGVEAKVEK